MQTSASGRRAAGALAAGLAALVGCADLDLGTAPFYCNGGLPHCPDGYRCVDPGGGGRKVCVKEGSSLPSKSDQGTTRPPDAGRGDRGKTPPADQNTGWPDLGTADQAPGDGPVKPPVDQWTPPPPDIGPLPFDLGPSPLFCGKKADCTDKSKPCCCNVPYLPLKLCTVVCFDPFCLF